MLHILRRKEPAHPDPLALDLSEPVAMDAAARVLELFDPVGSADAVDLALGARDLPEVVAALHWAEEVHLHGVPPELALASLPLVRSEVLENTLLVVQAPWPPLLRPPSEGTAFMQTWPGPCRIEGDFTGEASTWAPRAQRVEVARVYLDRHAPSLLPRSCGAVPLRLDDGRWLGVVALDAALAHDVRLQLKHGLRGLGRTEVSVDVCDESDLQMQERAGARRACQAFVTVSDAAPSRALLEASLQRLPIVVVGSQRSSIPDVVWSRGSAHEAVDRVVGCVRGWTQSWARGEAVTIDDEARRHWFDERWAA